jgi:hypothetical protein
MLHLLPSNWQMIEEDHALCILIDHNIGHQAQVGYA